MATVKDITALCKAGNVSQAYEIALSDLKASPNNVWKQRGLGWALYYLIKQDCEQQNLEQFFKHIDELKRLDQLDTENDAWIFDNIVKKIGFLISTTPKEDLYKISRIFDVIKGFSFTPSDGYAYLLSQVLHFANWERMTDFIEWWNLANLRPQDYKNFKMDNGRSIMSLAERVYIAYSKALLRINNKEQIKAFIPQIEKIVDQYPQMLYPGYFCGKLMLAVGATKDEELTQVIPFAQKKASQFWVWQLISEIFKDEPELQLACLLRAVHCKTQESFLVKVRPRLVQLYVARKDYARAKHHMDIVTKCYLQQGWRITYELRNWSSESWVKNVQADPSDAIDYMSLTNSIITRNAQQSIAIVTYIDLQRNRATLIYGTKQKIGISLSQISCKIHQGSLLKLQWTITGEGKVNVLGATNADEKDLKDISYIKSFDGVVSKMPNKPFAFVCREGENCFVTPNDVEKYNLQGNEHTHVLAALNYNKKKDEWNWSCISLKIA